MIEVRAGHAKKTFSFDRKYLKKVPLVMPFHAPDRILVLSDRRTMVTDFRALS